MKTMIHKFLQRMRNERRYITALTTDYTVTNADHGKIFTNRGASGLVTVTLPDPTINEGLEVEFFQVASQSFLLSCSEGLTVYNNATADTQTFSTASEMIGNGRRVVSDGTTWLVFNMIGDEASTQTIADS